MRYGKGFIGLFTAALLAVAVFFGTREYAWDGTVGLTVEVSNQGNTETIRCWESDGGDYYVFLPAYADLGQVWLRTNTRRPVYLDDQIVEDGMCKENLLLGVQYDLSFGSSRHFKLTFLQSANVPTMYIDTASGNMEHIHEEKGNEEKGTIRVYTAEGSLNHSGSLESIKGRGNATWLRTKKPYSLQLHTEADLLDMGQAQNWILLANAYDTSNVRNQLAYDLARDGGLAFSPEARWVDLYLNGTYAGLYTLCERNEVHPQRVDIAQKGSFLVSMELQYRLEEQGLPYVTTDSGVAFRIHYADMDTDTLRQILQSAENAILSEDGIDPATGKSWTELIDQDSFAKKYLLEEILANYDAGAVSQYFYFDGSDPSGKLYAGPAWDYDNTLGSREWQNMAPQALLANRPHISSETDAPWYFALYHKEAFLERVEELYTTVFRPLTMQLLETGIDGYLQQLQTAADNNALRWSAADYREDGEAAADYLAERMAFLDSLWIDHVPYCTVQVFDQVSTWGCFAVLPGDKLPQLPEYDTAMYAGWYRVDTGEPVDITQPVLEDMVIRLKPVSAENQ